MTAACFVMRLTCDNRPGIVAAIATRLFEGGFNILDSQQYDDIETNRFFVRVVFERPTPCTDSEVHMLMASVVERFRMAITVNDQRERRRVLLLASRFDHCLADLLYRWRTGELTMDIAAIVSNHPAETYAHLDLSGVEFHYLPVESGRKAEQEQKLLNLVDLLRIDLVVLARYMQILSNKLSAQLAGRCINIHHSFLPGFKGAKPYHQAFERGVKLIGATAHYVTADLDEGPIIEQDVERISHRDQPEHLLRKGRDIERRVLARAVRYHFEDRVLLNGSKTVVFPE